MLWIKYISSINTLIEIVDIKIRLDNKISLLTAPRRYFYCIWYFRTSVVLDCIDSWPLLSLHARIQEFSSGGGGGGGLQVNLTKKL